MIAELLEKDIEDKMKSELLTVSLLISKVKKMGQLPLEIEILCNKSELRLKICQTIVNKQYRKNTLENLIRGAFLFSTFISTTIFPLLGEKLFSLLLSAKYITLLLSGSTIKLASLACFLQGF